MSQIQKFIRHKTRTVCCNTSHSLRSWRASRHWPPSTAVGDSNLFHMSYSRSEITSGLASDFRTGWRTFAAFDALYKLLMFAVYTPISAWFFNSILASTGNAAVSNYDLTSFFLSPQGLLLVIVLSTVSFVLLFFETGGLVLIAAGIAQGKRMSATRTLQFLVSRLAGLCRLGFRQFLILGGIAGLALAIIALAKTTLLSASDIYFYLNVKPPEFWVAVAIASIALISAGSVMLSYCLFVGCSPRHSCCWKTRGHERP